MIPNSTADTSVFLRKTLNWFYLESLENPLRLLIKKSAASAMSSEVSEIRSQNSYTSFPSSTCLWDRCIRQDLLRSSCLSPTTTYLKEYFIGCTIGAIEFSILDCLSFVLERTISLWYFIKWPIRSSSFRIDVYYDVLVVYVELYSLMRLSSHVLKGVSWW